MKLTSLKCPNCNCTMQVNPEKKEVECVYCGTKFAIDEEKQLLQINNAEQLGYEFEKGRQKAKEEQLQGVEECPQHLAPHLVFLLLGQKASQGQGQRQRGEGQGRERVQGNQKAPGSGGVQLGGRGLLQD